MTRYVWVERRVDIREPWTDRLIVPFLIHSYWMWVHKIIVANLPAQARAAAVRHHRSTAKRRGRIRYAEGE
jgi:hypothetical protein